MASQPEAGGRRRLVLAASTRHDIEIGLPILLELAAALRSELATLFVTDEAQLAACALPFPALVSFSGGSINYDQSRFEAAVRHEAKACRRVLAHAAERARLAWTFETFRGESMQLMHAASQIGDILVINNDRSLLSPSEMITIARKFVPRGGGVLFMRGRTTWRYGPLVIIDAHDPPIGGLAQFANALAQELGASVSRIAQEKNVEAGDIACARLLVGTIESPIWEITALQQVMSSLGPPLLLLRRDFND